VASIISQKGPGRDPGPKRQRSLRRA